MKKLYLALSLLILPAVSQAAEITAGFGVEFLLLDGQSVEKIGKEAKKRIELENGEYQLVARYDNILKRGSQNMHFTSKPYVFELSVNDKDFELSVPLLRNEPQATAFFRNPRWQLTELDSKKMQIISAEELAGNGFAAYNDMEKAIAFHNAQKAPLKAQLPVQEKQPVTAQVVEQRQPVRAITPEQSNLEQLKFWYEKASNAEKKAFKQWMIEEDY